MVAEPEFEKLEDTAESKGLQRRKWEIEGIVGPYERQQGTAPCRKPRYKEQQGHKLTLIMDSLEWHPPPSTLARGGARPTSNGKPNPAPPRKPKQLRLVYARSRCGIIIKTGQTAGYPCGGEWRHNAKLWIRRGSKEGTEQLKVYARKIHLLATKAEEWEKTTRTCISKRRRVADRFERQPIDWATALSNE